MWFNSNHVMPSGITTLLAAVRARNRRLLLLWSPFGFTSMRNLATSLSVHRTSRIGCAPKCSRREAAHAHQLGVWSSRISSSPIGSAYLGCRRHDHPNFQCVRARLHLIGGVDTQNHFNLSGTNESRRHQHVACSSVLFL